MLENCGTIWFDKYKYVEAETRYYLWLQKKLYGIDVEGWVIASPSMVVPLDVSRSAVRSISRRDVCASPV
ncbi:elongation factor 1-delta isoform 2 [Tropilaelaps mercedesae]|uniref:Elongation factor 1-delta isoform 2 n=1 Tax=Tropilaelaps mercedesae TaxID=418985 RepID=A0A1V9X372_9ACAR|nr:elongation factor 1-delta isoform 2 [Tropilaelaps mercedesae]